MFLYSGSDLRTHSHLNELSLRQSPVSLLVGAGVQWGRDTQKLLANCCCQPLPGGTRGGFWGQGVEPITCLSTEMPQAFMSETHFFPLRCYSQLSLSQALQWGQSVMS